MISEKRVIAVIPARGGSKAIRKKSIAILGGQTLLTRAVMIAKSIPEIDRIIVSTDDGEIATVAKNAGAEVYERPAHLATDTALTIDALRDLKQRLRDEGETAQYMILLESTAPFRRVQDIRECLKKLIEGADSVATFTDAATKPDKAWRIDDGIPVAYIPGADAWLPRQMTPPAYEINGAVYAFDMNLLPMEGKSLLYGKTAAVLMPRTLSHDINTEFDLLVAELLLERLSHEEIK